MIVILIVMGKYHLPFLAPVGKGKVCIVSPYNVSTRVKKMWAGGGLEENSPLIFFMSGL